MKKFKIIINVTSQKEVFFNAENVEAAYEKLEELFFNRSAITFKDEDIISIKNVCKEIENERKEMFEIQPGIKIIDTEDGEEYVEIYKKREKKSTDSNEENNKIYDEIYCPVCEKCLLLDDSNQENGD